MAKSKQMQNKPTPKRKPNWRNTPDITFHGYPSWPSPESLHPGPRVTLAAVCGDEEAQTIVGFWAFREPVRLVASIPDEVSL